MSQFVAVAHNPDAGRSFASASRHEGALCTACRTCKNCQDDDLQPVGASNHFLLEDCALPKSSARFALPPSICGPWGSFKAPFPQTQRREVPVSPRTAACCLPRPAPPNAAGFGFLPQGLVLSGSLNPFCPGSWLLPALAALHLPCPFPGFGSYSVTVSMCLSRELLKGGVTPVHSAFGIQHGAWHTLSRLLGRRVNPSALVLKHVPSPSHHSPRLGRR